MGGEIASESATLRYEEQLARFRALEPDWDSYGGKPGDPDALEAARVFLQATVEGNLNLVPTGTGGVQFEIHWQGFDVEVEFEPRRKRKSFGEASGFWEKLER